MRPVPLRRRLFLLAVAGILPLAAMSGVALVALVGQQHKQVERAGLEIARALLTGVDADLGRAVAVLQAMATSPLIDAGNLSAFHSLSQSIAATRPHWQAVILADAHGRPLVNSRFAFGARLPPTVEMESLEQVVRSGLPVVGHAAKGPEGRVNFAARVPVTRDGEVRYVLTAVVRPESVLEVVNRQRLPDDWLVSVFDAKGTRVARSRQHYQYLGLPGSESLKRLMASGRNEGTGIAEALEGQSVFTAYSRSAETGWTVAIGIPRSFVDAGERRSLAAYGGGILLSIALGILAALRVARSINQPIGDLHSAAQALGRGDPPAAPDTAIREIRDVAEALIAASRDRARGEAERERLLKREQEARAAAEAANRAKDEFLAMLGHELRNPLGAISNAARLLEHPSVDAEAAARAREIIGRQADHLSRLTDDLLDAGRAVMGKIALQRRPLDLAAVAARALATLKAAGRTARHRIVQQLEPVIVEADAIRLEQIVVNLLVNAVKYTREGGTITLGVRPQGSEAVLTVADTGIGMPAELAPRVFDLFVQGDRALDRVHGGLGIGLTLVRRLAELHGGSASAHSEGAGRGSVFEVRLPAAPPGAATAAARTRPRAASPRDILIVEDNEDARETLKRLLELEGHRVRVAADGIAGVAAALEARPEVAFIDIGLPQIDGYEVARRLRSAPDMDRAPLLVALTGYGAPEDRRRALDAGFDEHLVKPVDPAALERLLDSLG